MPSALYSIFEEQVRFRLNDGSNIDGNVFIGSTEFLPLELLKSDPKACEEEFKIWYDEVWRVEQSDRRIEILKQHSNRGRYSDLCKLSSRNQIVPFIGSGMSTESGLPTWSDLLRKIAKYTNCDNDRLNEMLAAFQFEAAADMLFWV